MLNRPFVYVSNNNFNVNDLNFGHIISTFQRGYLIRFGLYCRFWPIPPGAARQP